MATQNISPTNEKRADQPLREAVDRFLSYIKKNIGTENYQSVKADGPDLKRGDILGRTAFLGRPATSRILGNVLESKFALAA